MPKRVITEQKINKFKEMLYQQEKHPNTIDKYIHIICGICLRDASTRSNRISPSLQMCLGMAISRQRESISNPQAENIKNI